MMKSLLCLLAILLASSQAMIPTCTRTFTEAFVPSIGSIVSYPYTLPAATDRRFEFTIDSRATGTFDSITVNVDISSPNSGDIKLRLQKNSIKPRKMVKNIGGSYADLYAGTQFYDGAANTVAMVAATTSSGVITPIDPEQSFSALGSIGPNDVITIMIRSNNAGSTVNNLSIELNLSGCSPTVVPTTTPVPTTPVQCQREFSANIGSPVNVASTAGTVSFPISFNENIESGDFQYLIAEVFVQNVNSGSLNLRLSDDNTISPLIRGTGGSTNDLWNGVSLFDSASTRVVDVTTYTADLQPLTLLSTFGTPTSGDTFTFLVKNSDSSNPAVVTSLKLIAVMDNCGTTIIPTTTQTPTTTPVPTTTSIPTCVREFNFNTGVVGVGADTTLNFQKTLGGNVNSGDIVDFQAYVDVASDVSSDINVRLRRGSVTKALIRGGNSPSNLWAGVTLFDTAAERMVDVTTFTSEIQPLFPLSSFGAISDGDTFEFLISNDGSGSVTVNELKLLLVMTDCGTTIIPTTVLPTTTPQPTTTPEPTTTPAECVRTYTMTENLPQVLVYNSNGQARPRFSTQQTGGTIIWADVYAEIECEQSGLLNVALSIEGDSTRRLMTDGYGGNQPNLYSATRWYNGAARDVTSVQPTGETAPISELRPLEFDFSAQDAILEINKQLRLVITYPGTGEVIVRAFSATFGFVGCEPTVTPAPTTAVPTTVEPTTAEPTTAEPTTAEPTTVEPTTVEPTTVEPTTAEPTTTEPSTTEPSTQQP